MILAQAMEFSRLSTVKVDGCTFSPELGISRYCKMHDHVLIHLVTRIRKINKEQYTYILSEGLPLDAEVTRLDADRLFRDGLQEKVDNKSGIKKAGYWFVKWVYYGAVRLRSMTGIGAQNKSATIK